MWKTHHFDVEFWIKLYWILLIDVEYPRISKYVQIHEFARTEHDKAHLTFPWGLGRQIEDTQYFMCLILASNLSV